MSAACMPPAPPKEKRAKSRGSMPRSMEMTRMAFSMLALAMSTMPWAVSISRFADFASETRDGRDAPFRLDLHLPAEEEIRDRCGRDEVGVGDRGKLAAAVAGRTGIGAGALGTDPERAAAIDVGDRAAARAHRVDVDDGQADGEVADPVFVGPPDAAFDEGDVG